MPPAGSFSGRPDSAEQPTVGPNRRLVSTTKRRSGRAIGRRWWLICAQDMCVLGLDLNPVPSKRGRGKRVSGAGYCSHALMARHCLAAGPKRPRLPGERLPDGDAVRVELEHAEGQAIAVLLPYKKKRLGRGLEFQSLRAGTGSRQIWADT